MFSFILVIYVTTKINTAKLSFKKYNIIQSHNQVHLDTCRKTGYVLKEQLYFYSSTSGITLSCRINVHVLTTPC